ncbi:MAG: non-canonical purine NTP pyrophosphatase, RdgB/HAM1 family [Spirochaetales bacterium]|nr:MAG: non-canonical purine NTP pyrophosphatase, RdgB/HAM1 family [Spirochaetales bacterium]
MEILLATGNAHKKEELSRIIAPHTVLTPQDAGIVFDAEETGSTYLENALIKAEALWEAAGGRPVLSDDSGLSVPALGGAPGVYSARYGSKPGQAELSAAERNALLLKNMESFSGEQRRAFFVCCMVLVAAPYRVFTVQETFSGSIARAPSGSGGFGYDPVFLLPGSSRSVAELPAGEKDAVSHRGRAGMRMLAILNSLEEQK